MATTIQISQDLQKELNKMKLFNKETYEEVIWNIIEDTKELNNKTKKEIELARKEFKQGKFTTHAKLKQELGV